MAESALALGKVEGLPQTQEAALTALRSGCSFMDAAELAGVDRTTLYRWLQRDPQFRAAYNLWQRELAESAQARLLKLTAKAVEVVEKALERGNEKVAGQLLKQMGVMRKPREESTDPELLSMQMIVRGQRDHDRVAQAMINDLYKKTGRSQKQLRQYIDDSRTALAAPAGEEETGEQAAGEQTTAVQAEAGVPPLAGTAPAAKEMSTGSTTSVPPATTESLDNGVSNSNDWMSELEMAGPDLEEAGDATE
jgi:hypothetical protein